MSAIIEDIAYIRASRKLEKYGIRIGQIVSQPYSSSPKRRIDYIEFPFGFDSVEALKILEKQITEYFTPKFSVVLNSVDGYMRIQDEKGVGEGIEIEFAPHVIIRPTLSQTSLAETFSEEAQSKIDNLLLHTNVGTRLMKYWTKKEKTSRDKAEKRLFEITPLGTPTIVKS